MRRVVFSVVICCSNPPPYYTHRFFRAPRKSWKIRRFSINSAATRRPRSFSSSTDIFGRQSATLIYPPVLSSPSQELHQSRFALSLSLSLYSLLQDLRISRKDLSACLMVTHVISCRTWEHYDDHACFHLLKVQAKGGLVKERVGLGFRVLQLRVLKGGESWGHCMKKVWKSKPTKTTHGNEDQVRRSSEQQCCQQF
jgi:hypothetical protein